MRDQDSNPANERPTSAASLLIAWLVVAAPMVWGVSQTVRTSIKLFQSPTATAPAPARP